MRDDTKFVLNLKLWSEDMAVHCMLPSTKEIVEECLMEYPDEPFIMLYDTTFNVGPFYASPLIFRNRCLNNDPVFPIGVLIHEKKLLRNHYGFINEIVQQIPPLDRNNIVFITDREFDFTKILSNCTHVFCWRHITDNVKRQLSKQGISSREMQNAIISNMYSIMKSESQRIAEQKAENYSNEWPVDFKDYYFASIAPAIRRSGRWVLEPIGMYSPISG